MKTIKNIFKSLINNQVCVDEGRSGKWWVAIIIGLVSVILAVLPITISAAKVNGDNFVSTNTYQADTYLLRFSEYLQDNEITLTIVEDENGKHLISNKEAKFDFEHRNSSNEIDFYAHVDTTVSDASIFNSDFEIYNQTGISFIYLSAKYMYCGLYSNGTEVGSTAGDYINVATNTEFSSFAKVYSDGTLINRDADPSKYRQYFNGTFSNWKNFFVDSYKTSKTRSVWSQTGLFAGIYTVLIMLLGFTIWVMCRGKQNPFRIFTLWNCQRIAYWAALCPAIIGFVIGLLLPNSAMMGFIMCFGIRLMWLSMNNLRPQYNYSQDTPTK